jgi:hypothetical protein
MSTTQNTFYIAGYTNGNQIGTVDSDGKLNYSDNLDFDSMMHFETQEEAEEYANKIYLEEKKELHPDFKYQVEEWDADYYSN